MLYEVITLEFVYTVSDIFHYPIEEYELLKNYILANNNSMPETARLLLIDGNKTTNKPGVRHMHQA